MSQHLTIAYITARKDPKLEWFTKSLFNQTTAADRELISLVIVDFYCNSRDEEFKSKASDFKCTWTPVKPNVWQGEHRLTKDNWWAAANARNTALCLAPDGWLAHVDDLSVLRPGWFHCVQEAMSGDPKTVTIGAYQKVNKLVVENGSIISFQNAGDEDPRSPKGIDHRIAAVKTDVSPCEGGWLYGYSVAHTDTWLGVGGWPEYAEGLKFEDCLMGIALENAGFKLQFDRRMMVYESDELHHVEGAYFISRDKGTSPNDKSHAALNIARQSKYFPNYYEGGIKQLRQDVLSGKPFPTNQIPQHDWYDGQPISEMT